MNQGNVTSVGPAGLASEVRPLVSAIIPSHDRPELAVRAARSALMQTYEHLEVLLVDDGSRPPLTLPAELASDPRLLTIRLENSMGPGAARNVGVRSSRGSLLAFLDDDDEWRDGKIARQVEILSGFDETVAAVETGFDLWDDTRLLMRYLPHTQRDLARTLLERPCLQPSTVLLRKSVFEAIGGFDPTLRRVEDWELWLRLADSHRTVGIAEVHVDRLASAAPAEEMLLWYRRLVKLLGPRIDALPSREQARVRATHALTQGLLLAQLGHTREARSQIGLAWRLRPRSWRPPAYLIRTVIGERAWEAGKRVARATAYPVARALGRDPLIRSW